MKATIIKNLKSLNAHTKMIEWAKTQPDPQTAWDNCERGDWMLWLLEQLAGDLGSESRKKLVLTACQCARLSLKYIPEGEGRSLKAIETAEAWANGKNGVSLEDVKLAADDAADVSIAYAAAYAAYVATDAAAAAAAGIEAQDKILKQCADIVREYYPEVPDMNKNSISEDMKDELGIRDRRPGCLFWIGIITLTLLIILL